MSKIMAVNAGSSSIKFQLLEMPEEKLICSGLVERIGEGLMSHYYFKVDGKVALDRELPVKDHAVGVQLVLDGLKELKIVESLDEITGVGHRVVQGGPYFSDSAVVNEDVKAKIKELIPLAPLHNPAHIVGIEAFEQALPGVLNVVVFDTAFHQTMPIDNYLYGTPYEWYTENKVRKYGAHGTSHAYVSKMYLETANVPAVGSKVITCHIGNGASITAVKDGKCLDTTMGLTPLDGFPMGTRSGHMDPTVISYIAEQRGLKLDEIINILNKKSGYLGMSGLSHDSRDLENAIIAGQKENATAEEKALAERCYLAFEVQFKRICDYIGSYYVLMGGCDAIVFTAGIGENSAYLREHVCNRLSALGVEINNELNYDNSIRGKITKISTDASKVAVYIIPTNEELVIARDVVRLSK